MIGGFLSGILVGYVPYWYLWAIAIVTHILGYIIYCVTTQSWLIMISRLLAGYILGAIVTLCFAYFSSSSEEYVEAQKKCGIKTDENSVQRARNIRFVTFAFGYSSGFIIGPGEHTRSYSLNTSFIYQYMTQYTAYAPTLTYTHLLTYIHNYIIHTYMHKSLTHLHT